MVEPVKSKSPRDTNPVKSRGSRKSSGKSRTKKASAKIARKKKPLKKKDPDSRFALHHAESDAQLS